MRSRSYGGRSDSAYTVCSPLESSGHESVQRKPSDALRTRIKEADLANEAQTDLVHQGREAVLRVTLAYAESIVDTVREPLVVLDKDLRVKTASRAFYQTFSVSKDQTEGKLIYELGDGQWNIPALRTLLEDVLPKEKSFHDFEVTHDFPTLGQRVMLLNAKKLWREENHTELVLLAIEDVTERKRTFDALVRSNEDLQSFAYVAAHDLRSPLNSSLNLVQLLERRLKGSISDEDQSLLTEAINGMRRLGVLMRDILSFSELGSAPQQRKLVSLQVPVDIALANLEHHIKANEAEITVEPLPELLVDRTQMVMVFQNLIGNALKYRRSEALRIRITAVQNGTEWKVSVADNGEGFDRQFSERIFEPFKRLHGKDIAGSGIGLATCKRVIDRLGGRIWAESTPGEGATFYFTLPT